MPQLQLLCEATNGEGSEARIASDGPLSVAANSLQLLVSGATTTQPGLFYYGDRATQVPLAAVSGVSTAACSGCPS